jgi:hypothetical protein
VKIRFRSRPFYGDKSWRPRILWPPPDDDQLRAMLKSGVKAAAVAQKLKRSIGVIQTRKSYLKTLRRRSAPRTYSAKRLTGGFRASFAGLKIPKGETGTRLVE